VSLRRRSRIGLVPMDGNCARVVRSSLLLVSDCPAFCSSFLVYSPCVDKGRRAASMHDTPYASGMSAAAESSPCRSQVKRESSYRQFSWLQFIVRANLPGRFISSQWPAVQQPHLDLTPCYSGGTAPVLHRSSLLSPFHKDTCTLKYFQI
jgi:hypothetical protein